MPRLALDDEVSLFYEVRGEEGPPLLLLNGLSQSTTNWISQSRELSKKYKVILFDARGQGKTPLGEVAVSPEVMAKDIDRLLDHLGEERVSVCGFSYGARMALFYAARRPARVEKVILTSMGLTASPMRRLILRSWSEVLKNGGLESMAWCALPYILGEAFIAQYERMIPAMIKASIQRNTVAWLMGLMSVMREFPATIEDARAVVCPALVLVARQDLLVDVRSGEALSKELPDGQFMTIENSGHTSPIERPVEWRDAVTAFLSS